MCATLESYRPAPYVGYSRLKRDSSTFLWREVLVEVNVSLRLSGSYKVRPVVRKDSVLPDCCRCPYPKPVYLIRYRD